MPFWAANLQYDLQPSAGKVRFAPPLAFLPIIHWCWCLLLLCSRVPTRALLDAYMLRPVAIIVFPSLFDRCHLSSSSVLGVSGVLVVLQCLGVRVILALEVPAACLSEYEAKLKFCLCFLGERGKGDGLDSLFTILVSSRGHIHTSRNAPCRKGNLAWGSPKRRDWGGAVGAEGTTTIHMTPYCLLACSFIHPGPVKPAGHLQGVACRCPDPCKKAKLLVLDVNVTDAWTCSKIRTCCIWHYVYHLRQNYCNINSPNNFSV